MKSAFGFANALRILDALASQKDKTDPNVIEMIEIRPDYYEMKPQ